MADYLAEAIKAAQQQAIASNPYANFGQMFGSAKMPANSGNPWNNLAGIAAQQAIAGLATGFGQADVNNQMQQIAPQIGQLYANPMAAKQGQVDDSVWGPLLNAAYQNEAARRAEQAQFMGQEKYKVDIAPDSPGKRTENMIKTIELNNLLREQGLDLNGNPLVQKEAPVVAVAPAAAASQIVAENPTPVATPVAPVVTATTSNVGDFAKIKKQFLDSDPTITPAQASEYANQYIKDKTAEALKIKESELRKGEKEADQKGQGAVKQAENFQTKLADLDKTYNNLDMAVADLTSAVKDPVDYGGVTGGLQELYDWGVGARMLPEGSEAQLASQRRLNSAKKLSTTAPDVIGKMIKETLSGPTSDKDLAFFLQKMPTKYETPGEQKTALAQLQKARDYARFKSSFMNQRLQLGRSPAQIDSELEAFRSALGGSFVNATTGNLKTPVLQFINPNYKGE